MGNTKTYYVEGELKHGKDVFDFRRLAADLLHCTYVAADVVEERGGYLGDPGNPASTRGPYLVGAIHTYSTLSDPTGFSRLFVNAKIIAFDWDNSEGFVLLIGSAADTAHGIDIRSFPIGVK
jgi:hypothetical protein